MKAHCTRVREEYDPAPDLLVGAAVTRSRSFLAGQTRTSIPEFAPTTPAFIEITVILHDSGRAERVLGGWVGVGEVELGRVWRASVILVGWRPVSGGGRSHSPVHSSGSSSTAGIPVMPHTDIEICGYTHPTLAVGLGGGCISSSARGNACDQSPAATAIKAPLPPAHSQSAAAGGISTPAPRLLPSPLPPPRATAAAAAAPAACRAAALLAAAPAALLAAAPAAPPAAPPRRRRRRARA